MKTTIDTIRESAEPRELTLTGEQTAALYRLLRQCSHGYVINALHNELEAKPAGNWKASLEEFIKAWSALQGGPA